MYPCIPVMPSLQYMFIYLHGNFIFKDNDWQIMESDSQTKVDPRKQALLEARFFGSGREDIEVSSDTDQISGQYFIHIYPFPSPSKNNFSTKNIRVFFSLIFFSRLVENLRNRGENMNNLFSTFIHKLSFSRNDWCLY